MTKSMTGLVRLACLAGLLWFIESASAHGLEAFAENSEPGFYRLYWYQKGAEHGNPHFNSRFRVNAPEVVLDPSFMHRLEVKDNGLMQIRIEEDLARLESAELDLELWGGHPGTANKRVTINGRSTYLLPEVGTAEHNCTHEYPVVRLKITDLVNGFNALQFACDSGSSFWGHFIVENACLRLRLKPAHPDLEKAGLAGFEASVVPSSDGAERISLSLSQAGPVTPSISRVEYHGYYLGYDENGNGRWQDWHGFSKEQKRVGHLGSVSDPRQPLAWDLSLLPDQDEPMAVRAVVRFESRGANPELVYFTAPFSGLRIPDRAGNSVVLIRSLDQPAPFWSRAGNRVTCSLQLDFPLERVEQAFLHTVIWDGGRGTVEDYFKLNGYFLPVAREGHHDVLYTVLPVPVEKLRQGANLIELLSDTDHHGIEMLRPGPTLVIRLRE
jgi:hypothetical protein